MAYDGNVSYRFLYKLRNYAQHCGVPIHGIQFHSVPDKAGPNKPVHSMEVSCSRNRLLSEYDGWGAQLKTEISQMAPNIEINPHVDSLMRSLEAINMDQMRVDFGFLRESATYIQELLNRVPPGEGDPGVFEIEIALGGTGAVSSIQHITEHPAPIALVNAAASGKIEDVLRDFVVYGV